MLLKIPLFFVVSSETGRRVARVTGLIAVVGLLGACTPPPAPVTMNDPGEAGNRQVHAFNRGLDRALLRPASSVYGGAVPEPLQTGLSNLASNLDLPGDVVNNVLQGRIANAAENTTRFAINTVIGIGGLFDPAKAIGLPGKPTDFGETLHRYGAGEGRYVELPGVGPSTVRDAIGTAVDIAANPVRLLLPSPEKYVGTAASIASTLGDRNRYSDTVESVLYDSADSYAQARLLYLQNRRFELGQTGGAEDAFLDPYEDPYAE
jgi:phospholipid-binding lipoprotein MlaA